MIVMGLTYNPLKLVNWMHENDVRYAVDRVVLNRQNIVFSSFVEFGKNVNRLKNKRVFVFDAREKLEYIQGISIYSESKAGFVENFLLNNEDVGPKLIPQIKVAKPIEVLIEKNKSMGILHEYNTTLYSITKKTTRDDVKDFVMRFVDGKVTDKDIDNLVKQTEAEMRQSKMKEALHLIFNMLKGSHFILLKAAMKDLNNYKGKVDRSVIEATAIRHKVETFDLHYFFSVLAKKKGKS